MWKRSVSSYAPTNSMWPDNVLGQDSVSLFPVMLSELFSLSELTITQTSLDGMVESLPIPGLLNPFQYFHLYFSFCWSWSVLKKKSKLLIFLHKRKDGMFSVSSWFCFQFGSYIVIGLRVTVSATALVFAAHSELWKPSLTLLTEITGKIVARRVQKSDIKRCSLIWRWSDFGISVPGSTGSRVPRDFPDDGHDVAVRSVHPYLCVSL